MSALAPTDFLRGFSSLLYPPACTICARTVKPNEYLCPGCTEKLTPIAPPFCAKCSEPFAGAITSVFDCANCTHRRLYFDAAVSAYRSRGIVRHVLLNFKYGRQVHLRHLVGRWLLDAFKDERVRSRQFDLIVPVPLHPAKQRERGFNQAEVLARYVSEQRGLACRPVLERTHYTTTQTAFDRDQRMQNLRGAFRLRKSRDVRKLRVLLIDDVLTTGSTVSECARVLKKSGAASVYAVTAARA
jgi:competence protein ComFC